MRKVFVGLMLAATLLLSGTAWAQPAWQMSAVIANGQTVGTAATLPQYIGKSAYIYIPTITSGVIKLQGSVDCTTYGAVYGFVDPGTALMVEWSVTAGTGGYTAMLPDLSPFRCIKVIAGAAQGAERTFTLFGTGKAD